MNVEKLATNDECESQRQWHAAGNRKLLIDSLLN